MKDFSNEEARYLVLLSYSRVNETRICDIKYCSLRAISSNHQGITSEMDQNWRECALTLDFLDLGRKG